MKNLFILLFIVSTIFTSIKIGSTSHTKEYQQKQVEFFLQQQKEIKFEAMIQANITSYMVYVNQIGMRESSMNYKAKNSLGYKGKYQFGRLALKDVKIPISGFLYNPENQEKAMFRYLKFNKLILKKEIEKYTCKKVHGIEITEAGLLAAAHLGGAGNVKKFLKTGRIFNDAYGTPITEYLQKFSGYSFDWNIVESRFDEIIEKLTKEI